MSHTDNEVKIYRKDRKDLEGYQNGEMVICPCISEFNPRYFDPVDGLGFLFKYGCWGFVNLTRESDYFALYITKPEGAVRFFGVIDKVVDPRKIDCPVEGYQDHWSYREGKKLILLEEDSIVELNDEILFAGDPIPTVRYTNFEKFMKAETTDDLWE